jgi:O-antigen/teichoic acid export membrane protein
VTAVLRKRPPVIAVARKTRGGAVGFGWAAAAQVVGMVVKLGSTLALTRLLAPEAYGLIGTAMVVLTTLEWLADLGVVPALLRHPDGGKPEWLLVGWWIGLGRGAGLSVAAFAAAGPLAAWYGKPELFAVLAMLAVRPIVMALRSPGMPELRRRLDGQRLFIDELSQAVCGTTVAVAVAYSVPDVGAWAIIAGTLAAAGVGVVVSYRLCPLRPRWYWDAAIAADLAGVGRQVLVNTLLMAAWLNADRLLGPKLLPLEEIGLYAVAWNLAAAAEAFLTRGTDVYFSLLTRQPNGPARDCWHRRQSGRILAVAVPLIAAAAVVAGPAVRLLYDPRYHAVGPVLAVLVARLAVRLVGQLDFQFLLANGDIKPATVGYAIGAIVQLVALPALAAFGGIGLAASVFASTVALTATQTFGTLDLRRGSYRLVAATLFAGTALAVALRLG